MIFERTYDVRFSETDRHECATPMAIYNYLQDAAIGHGEAVGVTPASLDTRGYAWILNRIRVDFVEYPSRSVAVAVKTWGSNLSGLYAVREWTATGNSGAVFARATSRWVLVDIQKKRAIRLPNFIEAEYGVHTERAIEFAFDRTTPTEPGDCLRHFHVRSSDLDANDHANSACYVDWCIEAVPDELLSTARPISIDIMFKQEARFGEEILATGSPLNDLAEAGKAYAHLIRRKSDDAILAYGTSRWP